jgi:hypothetical protein
MHPNVTRTYHFVNSHNHNNLLPVLTVFADAHTALDNDISLYLRLRLNMEVDFQSLFGLHVTRCAQLYSLADTPQLPAPPAFGLVLRGRYWSAKQDDISL